MITAERLTQQIEDLKREREGLQPILNDAFRQAEQQVTLLMDKAGILPEVQGIRQQLDQLKAQLQSRADLLTGQIEGYQKLLADDAEVVED